MFLPPPLILSAFAMLAHDQALLWHRGGESNASPNPALFSVRSGLGEGPSGDRRVLRSKCWVQGSQTSQQLPVSHSYHHGSLQSPPISYKLCFSLLPPLSPLTACAPESLGLIDQSCPSSFPGRRALSTTVCLPSSLRHLSCPSAYLQGLPEQEVRYKITPIPKCLISFQASVLACFWPI